MRDQYLHDGVNPLVRHDFTDQPEVELDPKDERLLSMAAKNGFLVGRNSALEQEAYRANERNQKLSDELESVRQENETLSESREEYRDRCYSLENQIAELKRRKAKK